MSMKRQGFTLVELLIVIVVIAILAAISIVAYNGIQTRSKFTKTFSDIKQTQKAIEMYYADKGVYPISANWSFQSNVAVQNTYIPGLVPDYVSSLPMSDPGTGTAIQYVYKTNPSGTDYKLIRYRAASAGGIPADEWSNVPDSMKDGTAATKDRYGVWSSGGYSL